MRGITVCVDYHDFLSITLAANRHHFSEFMVVTKPSDTETIRIASEYICRVHTTDVFTANSAIFNKWAALEEGLSEFGRHGWMAILDSDIIWPDEIDHSQFKVGCLYGPRRRILVNANLHAEFPASEWGSLPIHPEGELAGYTHIFHADDPNLGNPPWHQTNWRHAGGADSWFAMKWPRNSQIRPNFEVLHLGDPGQNWCGRATQYLDGSIPAEADERAMEMQRVFARHRRGDYSSDKISG